MWQGGVERHQDCVVHEAVAALLRAEMTSPATPHKRDHIKTMLGAVPLDETCEDFSNPQFNHVRFRTLLSIRRSLFWSLPPDTQWTAVEGAVWTSGTTNVHPLFPKTREALKCYVGRDLTLEGIWLWRDDKDVHHVLEGNHRVSGWIARGRPTMVVRRFFVASSPLGSLCTYHSLGKPGKYLVYPNLISNSAVWYDGQRNPEATCANVATRVMDNFQPWRRACSVFSVAVLVVSVARLLLLLWRNE